MIHTLITIATIASLNQSPADELKTALDKTGLIKINTTTRDQYIGHMAEAAAETSIDILLIASVAYVESRWLNLRVNKTKDRGIMQVHWQPRMPWLRGVKRKDLLNPRTNILIGARELAHMRAWCFKYRKRRPWRHRHKWWSHYFWGPNVKNSRYERAVGWIYRRLQRAAGRQKVRW